MLAFMFPGQGSQFAGMGKALAAAHPVARETFAEADMLLGRPLSELCFEGPADELGLTRNAQPAILATSIAAYRVLAAETDFRPTVVCGHSLGEITAYVCAGALDFGAALELVQQRGDLMQEAVPLGVGGMVAVMGLPHDEVAEVCAVASESEMVSIANYNGPTQLVIAGHIGALDRASQLAQRRGGSVRSLDVSAPFHCALMGPAIQRFGEFLQHVDFRGPLVPVVDGTTAELHRTRDGLAEVLAAQIGAPVRWDRLMNRLAALHVWATVEIGPGSRLTSMLRRAEPGIRATRFEEAADLESVLALAAERPYLDRPLGRWQIGDAGDLFSQEDLAVVWAGTDVPEPVTEVYWSGPADGTRVHRYGTMAVITPERELQVLDHDRWSPREDGAYVRKDHMHILKPSGEVEHFDPDDWTVDRSGTMRRVDGSRIIWSDGLEWSFAAS